MFRLATAAPLILALLAHAQTPIGAWRDHLPYRNMVDVVGGDGGVYCATANAVFHYSSATGETRRLSKVNLLNDVDIRGLAWCDALGMLLVHYGNGNLDLVQGGRSYNMGDIKRSSILGDKAIYRIRVDGTTAYLACGFGIVVVDLDRREVRETWLIGPGGSQVRVRAVALTPDSVYAATHAGLFAASRAAGNLASFTNWRKRADMSPSMANGPFTMAAEHQGRLFLTFDRNNSPDDTVIFLNAANQWEYFGPGAGTLVRELRASEDGEQLLLGRDYDVVQFDAALQQVASTTSYGPAGQYCTPARMARTRDGVLWVADRDQGLMRMVAPNTGQKIRPNGPESVNVVAMAAGGGVVYAAAGATSGNWGNTFLKDGVHHFGGEAWRSNNMGNTPLFATGANDFGGAVNDVVAVAVDPIDPRRAYAGSWDEGVIEFVDRDPVAIHNSTNSSLGLQVGEGGGKVNVGGIDFDEQGNMWVSNALAAAPISVRKRNGQWRSFNPGAILGGNALLGAIVAAQNGLKWLIRPRATGLLVFNDGGTIDDPSDDQYKLLNGTAGSGGLPTIDVLSIAEDLEGQIWVGTSKGVAVFYTPGDLFTSNPSDAQQILIEQGGNVQALLETDFVSAIAVDGANRKWLGTQTGGVYLVSADGREQIHHFTEQNSPLPSNLITAIAIDGATGEVFIGTDRGIVSYRSDAIDPEQGATCAKVFPNPVREGYTGPVAITGLPRDSEVRITDMAGNLVHVTRSLGGQAVWNIADMGGARVATGVYLVFAADPEGAFKCNTKVLVAR